MIPLRADLSGFETAAVGVPLARRQTLLEVLVRAPPLKPCHLHQGSHFHSSFGVQCIFFAFLAVFHHCAQVLAGLPSPSNAPWHGEFLIAPFTDVSGRDICCRGWQQAFPTHRDDFVSLGSTLAFLAQRLCGRQFRDIQFKAFTQALSISGREGRRSLSQKRHFLSLYTNKPVATAFQPTPCPSPPVAAGFFPTRAPKA